MSIQSNINQIGSVALLLASQTPGVKALAEKRNLQRQKGSLEKASIMLGQKGKPELSQEYADKVADIDKKIFETAPSAKTAEAMLESRYDSTEGMKERATTVPGDPEEIAQEMYEKELREKEVQSFLDQYRQAEQKAEESLAAKQEEKRKARRSFIDYMKDEPTSLGGSFGELSPKIQKLLAQSYSKTERQKIMDRKDETDVK